jgi:hypothetical protein
LQTNSSAAESTSTTRRADHPSHPRMPGTGSRAETRPLLDTRRLALRCDDALGDIAVSKNALRKENQYPRRCETHPRCAVSIPLNRPSSADQPSRDNRLHTSTRGRHRATRRGRPMCGDRSDLQPHSRRQTSCTDCRRTPEDSVHRIPGPSSARADTGKGRTAPTDCVASGCFVVSRRVRLSRDSVDVYTDKRTSDLRPRVIRPGQRSRPGILTSIRAGGLDRHA